MGLRGRKSISAEEHKLCGTARNKKLDSRHDHTVIVANADLRQVNKPDFIIGEAEEVWNDIVPKLMYAKMICALDVQCISDYCQTVADKRRLERYIQEYGQFHQNSNRSKRLRIEVKLLQNIDRHLFKLMDALGLTPKSRKSMNIKLNLDIAIKPLAKVSILTRRK